MLIEEYYKGKNIFITGGTGFMGKVLIEKLLRSCPDLGNIYILIREKRGKSVEQRIELMKALPLFGSIREQNADVLNKMIPVKGDVCQLNLGLSEEDRQMIIENVNIIYHTAASVRFDDFLKEAVFINVRGTREVAQLALELKNISLLVHISTTYCNTDQTVIEEKIYPPHANWRDTITLAEECDGFLLNTLTERYIRPLPNTYTFCKSLGEHVINDMCKGKIPAIIIRPSVVISTLDEPILGWNDNFNGPVGLLVAGGKGLLKTILGDTTSCPDYIPVDVAIKVVIVAAQRHGGKVSTENVEVYNLSQGSISRINVGEVIEMGRELITDAPFSSMLWYPRFSMTNCFYYYFIQVLLFHMLPAFFLDIALRVSGKKPMLFSIQRKIYIANVVLLPFISYSWTFINDKILKLKETLDDEEQLHFGVPKFRLNRKEQFEFFKHGKIGAARYILKEDFDDSAEQSRRNLQRMWYLDIAVRLLFAIFLFWFLNNKLNIFRVMYAAIENYFISLPQ